MSCENMSMSVWLLGSECGNSLSIVTLVLSPIVVGILASCTFQPHVCQLEKGSRNVGTLGWR
jgi:hypothetical protein